MNAPTGRPAAPAADPVEPLPEPPVTWIADAPPRPICDVPWLGGSIVMSNGAVNFCCFTSAVVGNVNERPFQEIWQGAAMQRIRQSLSDGQLPPECRTGSCPIFRGDDKHYLVERMNGANLVATPDGEMRTSEKIQALRQQLQGSSLAVERPAAGRSQPMALRIELACSGEPLALDLFIAIDSAEGRRRFLPALEDYALPYACDLLCGRQSLSVTLDTDEGDGFFEAAGLYRVCAAAFLPGSNPSISSNCLWAGNLTVRLG